MALSSSSSGSEEEWEDVELLPFEGTSLLQERDDEAKAAAVEIILSAKDSAQRGRKQNALERALAAFNRDLRHNLHKTSLLCLLVHGMEISSCCNDSLLQAKLFSLTPQELLSNASGKLTKLVKWFVARKDHLLAAVREEESSSIQEGIDQTNEVSRVYQISTVQMLVALLRTIGLRTRLVLALNPISFKPSRKNGSESPCDPVLKSEAGEVPAQSMREPASLTLRGQGDQSPSSMFSTMIQQLDEKSGISMDHSSSVLGGGRDSGGYSTSTEVSVKGGSKRRAKTVRGGGVKKRKVSSSGNSAAADTTERDSTIPGERRRSSRLVRTKGKGKAQDGKKKPTTMCETSPYFSQMKDDSGADDGGSVGSGDDCSVSDDSDFLPVKRKSSHRLTFESVSSDSDEGGAGEGGARGDGGGGSGGGGGGEGGRNKKGKRTGKGKTVKGQPQKIGKGISMESENKNKKEEESGVYEETSSWAEVFLEDQKRYVCLHLPSRSVDQPKMCEKHCPHRISYIVAIENGEFCPCVSDVTARYASDWCTATRRFRLSESWWQETLQPYAATKEERELEEEDIMNILYSHPLPTSVNDYKSHPLYVLRRHLLKFEAIYPFDSKILGYCKGEPVQSRDCVHTLHTRETWLKEGRVVKKDGEPYKVVKARPKKGQTSLERENSTVEVFGRWQTEVYVPPPVVDGIVPRNEYGNVELFQPSMLPAGACHIRIAGIYKVARKLGVDYAPAMMGWDFHSGHCCPIIEGIVVAQENDELLREAWRQEEQLLIEKQMKKRESRVLELWKKLTRGVLIRERVMRTYSLI